MRTLPPRRSYGRLVDLSGVIFVALALAWAVYLIPQALKRHDEVARTRSIDRFSSTMRVLAPARVTGGPVVAPSQSQVRAELRAQVRTPVPSRAAARAAARRRRRVLLVLLGLTALTAATIGVLRLTAGVGPWWSVAIPGGLVVTWLVVCRLQVRRLDRVRNPRYEGRLVSPDEEDTVRLDADALRRAVVGEDAPATEDAPAEQDVVASAIASATTDPSLWDPLPVTLPTYVSKPRAQRTVRTIDLSQPDLAASGVVSSGRNAEDSRLVAETAEAERRAEAAEAAADDVAQRATGT